tara:strand:- start:688 stop:942 length:255 start_codon:yes stop_codon:yes gene_type:complete
MARKGLADHVLEVMEGQGWIESSLIRDKLYDLMKGGTPSIRELNAHLRKNKNVNSRFAPAGKTQIKKYAIKNPQKKIIEHFERG